MIERLRQAANVPDSRERQDILNQPWEFEEVVLSPKEMARVRRGPASNALFEQAGALTVSEFRLRELAVRLRTINNACDSGAQLPDGRPITEVSLYGSRDRQYLVAPYFAVRRLMKGIIPADDKLTPGLAACIEEWEKPRAVLRSWWAQLRAEPAQSVSIPFEEIKQVTAAAGRFYVHDWKQLPPEKRVVSWNQICQVWMVEDAKLSAIDEYLGRDNPFLDLQQRMLSSADLQKAKGQWWFTYYEDYQTLYDEMRHRKSDDPKGAIGLYVFFDKVAPRSW